MNGFIDDLGVSFQPHESPCRDYRFSDLERAVALYGLEAVTAMLDEIRLKHQQVHGRTRVDERL